MTISRRVLRAGAMLIAIAGVADPTLTRSMQVRERLAIVAVGAPAGAPARRLQAAIGADYTTSVDVLDLPTRTAACPSAGACVIVSSGSVPDRVTAGATVVGGVRVTRSAEHVIATVDTPPHVHLNASSALRVRLDREVSRVEVFDEGVLVGFAPSAGPTVDVPWVPLAEGARALRVVAGNDAAHVGVVVSAESVAVLFHEPEPTWLGTFVRRALDDDGRFTVSGRTVVAPAVAITRGNAPRLTADSLRNVSVVVVTAPDGLTAAEVDALERFATRRGGSVVVLPDRRPTGPIVRLLPRMVDERREERPQRVGPLRATELLLFEPAAGTSTLAVVAAEAAAPQRARRDPVVVSRAIGRGRVIVSGALDAWRYRHDNQFEIYWAGVVWDAAVAAGPALRVGVHPGAIRPNDAVRIGVETQSIDPLPADLTAEAIIQCGADRQVLRLWPRARPGTFDGVFRPETAGRCRIDATVSGVAGSTSMIVSSDVAALEPRQDRLAAIVAAHGGVLVEEGAEDELVTRIREVLPGRRQPMPTKPMHSWWWMVPFVMCLGLEWWLRRRAGMR